MTLHIKVATMVLVLLGAGGCAPSFYYFYYLSLAGVPGIEVLEQGFVDRVALFDEPMPIRYQLVRNAYVIEFELERRRGSPHIWMRATMPSGAGVALEPTRDDRCDYLRYSNTFSKNEFRWSSVDHCLLDGNEAAVRQVIGLVVRESTGNVLGKEDLPFEIVRNGIVIEIDAI